MGSTIATIIAIPIGLIFVFLAVRLAVKVIALAASLLFKIITAILNPNAFQTGRSPAQRLQDYFYGFRGRENFNAFFKNSIHKVFNSLTPFRKRRKQMSTEEQMPPAKIPPEATAPDKKKSPLLGYAIIGIVVFVVLAAFAGRFFTTIPAGHVGVGTLFGKVKSDVYTEGIHLKNPLMKITLFDARQKTYKDAMGVPSSDQLITKFDLSIQYRLIKEQAPVMLKETGTPKEVLDVHMMPLLRSLMREIGKSVPRAENFYEQAVQQRIQEELLTGLSGLAQKGIKIEKLLIRDVTLPSIITNAVMRKKEAAQAAEKAKEELKKFRVDQERKEAQAEAEKKAELIQANKKKEVMLIAANAQLEAAKIEAKAILVRAEAEAAAKKKLIDAVTLEGYVRLESMKVLKELQKGNHLIIVDPNAASPLPFLNLDKIQNPK